MNVLICKIGVAATTILEACLKGELSRTLTALVAQSKDSIQMVSVRIERRKPEGLFLDKKEYDDPTCKEKDNDWNWWPGCL